MELGLRLGDGSPFGFPKTQNKHPPHPTVSRRGLDFCLVDANDVVGCFFGPPPPPQLDLLLPRTPLASRPSSETDVSEAAAAEGGGNPLLSASLEYGGRAAATRPENSSGDEEEEEQNLGLRKKLRLSREQSAFLEESFKEHHSLYPKQKVELAKRLNLRPRQVEVWFQNRRARTKLKQTEEECEYLKKWCETLSQHNTKLLKELTDLKALKTTDSLFFHLPPTTLTICTSCQRAAGKHLADESHAHRTQ